MLDIQMSSSTIAIKIRMEYTRKKNSKVDLGNLKMVNCVMLATRVSYGEFGDMYEYWNRSWKGY